jgi:hypothetical protein
MEQVVASIAIAPEGTATSKASAPDESPPSRASGEATGGGTVGGVLALWDRLRRAPWLLHAGLILFVLAWLLGPKELRDAVPIWLPFLIALGLEIFFFVEAQRGRAGRRRPDRGPQVVDRQRYGYEGDAEELILVRRGDEEIWVPYSGETHEELDELVAESEGVSATPYVPERLRFHAFRRLLVGVGLIGVLAAGAWYVERNRGWEGLDAETQAAAERRFSTEASRLARHGVEIRCDDSGEIVGVVQHADGVAEVGGDLAYLAPDRCYDLYRLAFNGDVSFSQTARGIAVLAHESWHLAGVRDEGTTECYALQSGVELGRRLGLGEGTARRMMRQQLVENAGRGAASEYVVGPDCRDGGELDLDPRSSDFP